MKGVSVVSTGGLMPRTIVREAETEREIKGITRLQLDITAHQAIRATAELAASALNIDSAAATFQVAHPVTGKLTDVTSIIFADGERVDF